MGKENLGGRGGGARSDYTSAESSLPHSSISDCMVLSCFVVRVAPLSSSSSRHLKRSAAALPFHICIRDQNWFLSPRDEGSTFPFLSSNCLSIQNFMFTSAFTFSFLGCFFFPQTALTHLLHEPKPHAPPLISPPAGSLLPDKLIRIYCDTYPRLTIDSFMDSSTGASRPADEGSTAPEDGADPGAIGAMVF